MTFSVQTECEELRAEEFLQLPPNSAQEQEAMATLHPIALQTYIIPTPPLVRCVDLALERVRSGSPCCGFVGVPRFGKSSAADFVASEIRSTAEQFYVVQLVGRLNGAARPGAFCDWIYQSTGGPAFHSKRGGVDPLLLVARRWVTDAFSAKARRLVLIVDELGRFTPTELTYLADITNETSRNGLKVTTIGFGSGETLHLRDALLAAERVDLIGRFLSRLHAFDGLVSVGELQSTMEAYDDPQIADYPRNSGWAFSQFFLPTAYANGWRLANEAPRLWRAFQEAVPTKKKKSHLQLGAEYFTCAIEWALKKSRDFSAIGFPEEIWIDAVSESGFIESLGVTYNPQEQPVSSTS